MSLTLDHDIELNICIEIVLTTCIPDTIRKSYVSLTVETLTFV